MQAAGLVPIVEPEVLIDGPHGSAVFAEVSERVISQCVAKLWQHNVLLEGCLLKPQMIIAVSHAGVELQFGCCCLQQLVPGMHACMHAFSSIQQVTLSALNALQCSRAVDDIWVDCQPVELLCMVNIWHMQQST